MGKKKKKKNVKNIIIIYMTKSCSLTFLSLVSVVLSSVFVT